MKSFWLFAWVFSAVVLGVYRAGSWQEEGSSLPISFTPPQEMKFVVVLYGYNHKAHCERALQSLFSQDFDDYRVIVIDDGSTDGTYDQVLRFIVENQLEQRVILLREEKKEGAAACLYRLLPQLQKEVVVVWLEAKDWLASPQSLSEVASLYRNRCTWMTKSDVFLYPSYTVQRQDEAGYGCTYTFYAHLLKEIPLACWIDKGRFRSSLDGPLRLLERAIASHVATLKVPNLFVDTTLAHTKKTAEPIFVPPSSQSEPKTDQVDLILFSYDRPLQLYACLESIERYMTGVRTIQVVTRYSHETYHQAYLELARTFPHVVWLFQHPELGKKEFKSLVYKALKTASSWVLFGVDDLIVKDFVDLTFCSKMLQETKGYGFFLRFGHHIRYSYQAKNVQEEPEHVALFKGVFAWDIEQGSLDWGFPNSLDMTLYAKETVLKGLKGLSFNNPTSLESNWAQKGAPLHPVGLYFDRSKVCNLPLNIVDQTDNPHMDFASTEQLQERFMAGEKIDIDPFFGLDNSSPHVDLEPKFIPRR
jgi:hypothetical protein